MKQIKAFIHRDRIAEVLQALNASGCRSPDERSGCRNISTCAVQSLIDPIDKSEQHYSMELAEPVVQEWRLELFCEDAQVDGLLGLIGSAARIGHGVAGWIFVTDIVKAEPIHGTGPMPATS